MNFFKYAESIMVLTGAGISAESGVPTFRGGGNSEVWKGMPLQQISSVEMVNEDLDEVWEWFDYRREVLSRCSPNTAHEDLVKMEDSVSEFLLVTQNVDGLHTRAGSKAVIEIHGNINRARCLDCSGKYELSWTAIPHDIELCEVCGGKVRPDVVLFGESLPPGAFETAVDFASGVEVCVVIGTSSEVYPAAALPGIAKRGGARIIEINPEETGLSDLADVKIREPATVGLSQLVEHLL